MKRLLIILSLIFITLLLPGCSSKASYELVDSSVTITSDQAIAGTIRITEGEMEVQEFVPTVLYYQFTLKNNGFKTIANNKLDPSKGLDLRIEPSEKLKNITGEILGFNIFGPEGYVESGLGYEYAYSLELKPGKQAVSTVTYQLGVSEKNPNIMVLAPSEEKLGEILKYATDADLVIMENGVEIARFDLSDE